MDQKIELTYRTSVIVVSAMITGQLLFAAIAWFLGAEPDSTGPITLSHPLMLAWALVAAGSLFGAFYFRQRIFGHDRSLVRAGQSASPVQTPASVHKNVIIMWSLQEAAALMGLVIFMVRGGTLLPYAVLAHLALTALLFFPRREWFDSPHG